MLYVALNIKSTIDTKKYNYYLCYLGPLEISRRH